MLCQIVNMDGFTNLLKNVSPEITICVRGRHAVGKSEGVYQAAAASRSAAYKDAEFCKRMVEALGGEIRCAVDGIIQNVTEWSYERGLPVIERRLSQMTEGDIIGLPEFHNIVDGEGRSWRSTKFQPCDWLILSSQFPSVLFLDERNRALPGVKQAVFQLADSKAFYGHNIHKETKICVAENVGMNYQVEQSDPAEVSRWVTIELEPTPKEWFKWAEGKVHLATLEFLRANEKCLEHLGTCDAEKKYPDRRSWYKLDKECQRLGFFDSDNPNEGNLLYIMAGAFLGAEVGNKFHRFILERDREVKALDIITDWKKAKKRLGKGQKGGISNAQYVECTAKLGDWVKVPENKLTVEQAQQYAAFMHDAPPEPRMTAWSLLSEDANNLFMVHPYISKLMVHTSGGRDTTDLSVDKAIKDVEKQKGNEGLGDTKAKKGRGRKKK